MNKNFVNPEILINDKKLEPRLFNKLNLVDYLNKKFTHFFNL